MGFAGYFLIVADFINYAKPQQHPGGAPAGARPPAAWPPTALGITGVDPIEYDIIFERFLNPERISMPDIDVDFCMKGRDQVIRYVADKYNDGESDDEQEGRADHHLREAAGQGRRPRRGSRAGHALRRRRSHREAHPRHAGDSRSGGGTRAVAASCAPGSMPTGRSRKLFETAQRLEGLTRHASTHAAGVVIGTEPH